MRLTPLAHLKPSEFIDLLEGTALPPGRESHLDACSRCRLELEAIAPLYEDLGNAAPADTWLHADWEMLREGVRNGLLGRAAARASRVGGWTGWPVPRVAWGLTVVLLASVLSLASLWYARKGGPIRATGDGVGPGTISLLPEDPEVLETEAISWPQTDIFAELAELDSGQQEVLREMIRLSLAEEEGSPE